VTHPRYARKNERDTKRREHFDLVFNYLKQHGETPTHKVASDLGLSVASVGVVQRENKNTFIKRDGSGHTSTGRYGIITVLSLPLELQAP
jgi:hypothetical protein